MIHCVKCDSMVTVYTTSTLRLGSESVVTHADEMQHKNLKRQHFTQLPHLQQLRCEKLKVVR